ncbi:MAG TPA: DUF167 domain-containing protein [Burkholderiales bacterium]|nr:DUF167 domain-containing protein [Burkholderiales bacterium]
MAGSWHRYDPDRDLLTLVLRVQPNASRTEFAGFHGGYPKVRVAAPAIEGRANALLLDFLKKKFDVRGRQVIITRGSRGRTKTIEISNPGQTLLLRLKELLQ